MVRPARVPVSVISRYVVTEFARLLALTVSAFIGIYLIVDFFDRLDSILKNNASASAALRYLAFKERRSIADLTREALDQYLGTKKETGVVPARVDDEVTVTKSSSRPRRAS